MPRLARLDATGILHHVIIVEALTDYALSVLSQANERFERRYELKRSGYDTTRVAKRVAELVGIAKEGIFLKGRPKKRSDARGLFCYWCAGELFLPQTELARNWR